MTQREEFEAWYSAQPLELRGKDLCLAAWQAAPDLSRLEPFVSGLGKAILRELQQAAAEPVGEVRAKSDAYGGTFVLWKKLPTAGMMLYTTPPATQAVPAVLTDDVLMDLYYKHKSVIKGDAKADFDGLFNFARAAIKVATRS